MFGNNAISSSWANPQQNQQQQPQQQPNAFGQPSGFGTAGFATGAFGQPQQPQQQQQQQQPQANPMFGNLGGTPNPNTTTPNTGFGAFGGSTTTAPTNGGIFGQSKPTTGFGAFGGGTSTFGGGGTGAFGSTNPAGTTGTGTGLFGAQPSTSTSGAFGGSTLFGANKPATGFGAPTTSAQPGADSSVAPVTTGTANPPYQATNEKDQANPNLTLQYQSITCMPQYRGSSFEELRWQDYQQGRKTAGAFGQTTFGAPAQPATGLFGQPAPQNPVPAANPMFGAFGNTNTNATPAPATSGAFGAFGQPTNTQGTTATGIFGGGSFGQQPQQQQPQQAQATGFGQFGQPQQNAGTGLFGGGSAFGANNNQQKPPGFGAFGGSTGAFGNTNTFGQPQGNQQGAAGGGIFGQPAQPQQAPSAFGTFGNNTNNAPKPSIFGNPQPAQQTTAFGAFGNPQQNQAGQQQQGTQPQGGLFGGGNLFGNNPQQPGQQQQQQQQPPQGTGIFGATPAQQPAGGGLFGGGSLFGNNQNQQQQPQPQQQQQPGAFNLFGGAKPAAPATQPSGTGLFGGGFSQPQNNTSTQPSSIFGTPLGQQPNNQQGTSAFGPSNLFNKPAAPQLGQTQSTGLPGGSIFGNLGASTNPMNTSTLGQSAQGSLTASIAQPIATNLPIFSMLPPGPRVVNLDQSPKKKPGYFVDVPTRSPVPRLGLSYAPASTKLRGFSSTSTAPSANAGSSLLFPSSKPNALSLSKASNGKSVLGPDAFLSGGGPSPTLGSGGKKSVKKLVLDKKVEPSELFSKSGFAHGAKVTFSPALSVAAREKEAAAAASSPPGPRAPASPSPAPQNNRGPHRFSAQSSSDVLNSPSKDSGAPTKENGQTELQEGDYWMKPDLETLKKAGHEELVSLKGLVVGRQGYGQITFLDPVDLTNVPKLSGLLGELVRFDDQECSVYPDSDEADKPPPGSGLNVRARIELIRCWALDKATREPIKDEKHPHAVRHLKRLKNMKRTHFESFDLEQGKWTFTVDHF